MVLYLWKKSAYGLIRNRNIININPHLLLSQSAWAIARKAINENLQVIADEGTWKNERIITTAQGPHIKVEHKQQNVINFCANNYLGLSVRIFKCLTLFFKFFSQLHSESSRSGGSWFKCV